VLEHILHEIEVECLPTALPDHVEADVSGLDIGDTCRVKDLEAIPDVKILAHDDDVLLVVAPPTKAPEAAPAPTEAATVVAETPEPEVIRKKEEE
jgi:large subunit ribosomal protein L25